MTVGEQSAIAAGVERAMNDSLGSSPDLPDGLAVDDAVFPEIPPGAIFLDFCRRTAFVVAVVPLVEIVVDDGVVGVTRGSGLTQKDLKVFVSQHKNEAMLVGVNALDVLIMVTFDLVTTKAQDNYASDGRVHVVRSLMEVT